MAVLRDPLIPDWSAVLEWDLGKPQEGNLGPGTASWLRSTPLTLSVRDQGQLQG